MMLVVLLLTGCTAGASEGKKGSGAVVADDSLQTDSKKDRLALIEAAEIDDVSSAAEEMSSLIKTFKTAVESDDREEAARQAERMAALWKSLSEKAVDAQPEKLQQIEADLVGVLDEVAASDWDKTRLVDLDYSLYQGFRDVKPALQN
ncbi:hypothetical protein DX130_12855 [Paenibacillus paeoniae]|uniref:DUF4363 family protein n=2 Tax=Paenibacillus paeoniae TaxID=2292705 RepID=A0A371PF59_9BACL|nr:hypothetical protein DX130_12855 [Paenibacillus paeoniae]